MRTFLLKSSDGEVFETDAAVALMCGFIKVMIQDCNMDEGDDVLVPLPGVDSIILRKVLQWATFHKDDPVPLEDDDSERDTDISSWDVDFLRVDQDTLKKLVLAAHYLECKGLLNVASKTVANIIVDEETEEIRTFCNAKNDFTAAEIDHIHSENESGTCQELVQNVEN